MDVTEEYILYKCSVTMNNENEIIYSMIMKLNQILCNILILVLIFYLHIYSSFLKYFYNVLTLQLN